MCKQPHLCKHFGLKCANNHICANISASNVQTTTFVQTFLPQMCKQPHLCKHFGLKCANNHIRANTAPSNVQICILKIHQPLMCKHDAIKCAKFQFWCEICKHPTNVQIVLFIKNQFTSTKLSIQMVDYFFVKTIFKKRTLEQIRGHTLSTMRTDEVKQITSHNRGKLKWHLFTHSLSWTGQHFGSWHYLTKCALENRLLNQNWWSWYHFSQKKLPHVYTDTRYMYCIHMLWGVLFFLGNPVSALKNPETTKENASCALPHPPPPPPPYLCHAGFSFFFFSYSFETALIYHT